MPTCTIILILYGLQINHATHFLFCKSITQHVSYFACRLPLGLCARARITVNGWDFPGKGHCLKEVEKYVQTERKETGGAHLKILTKENGGAYIRKYRHMSLK